MVRDELGSPREIFGLERGVARCRVSVDFGRAVDELNVVELCSSNRL